MRATSTPTTRPRRTVPSIALVALALAAATARARADEWRWVVPPQPKFAHAPLRALPLSERKPDDVALRFTPSGRASWAQLRFGTADSRRVALLLVEKDDGGVELYADANRDRALDASELVSAGPEEAGGATWKLPLRVAAADEELSDLPPRELLFRLGKGRVALTYAVLGCLEGTISFGKRTVRVRRVDADGNGLLDDLQDALWFDLSGTGEWDALEERVACAPLVALEGSRWLVRTDPFGRRLALEEVKGTGTLTLAPAALAKGVEAGELTVTLAARDGSAFLARGKSPSLTLPAGDYRVAALTIALTSGGASTSYTFTREFLGPDTNWHALAAGATLALDPLGAVKFDVEVKPNGAVAPGTALSVQPTLTTSEGLHIVTASAPEARIDVRDAGGASRATSFSGFA